MHFFYKLHTQKQGNEKNHFGFIYMFRYTCVEQL